jgi:hypothetical protein
MSQGTKQHQEGEEGVGKGDDVGEPDCRVM